MSWRWRFVSRSILGMVLLCGCNRSIPDRDIEAILGGATAEPGPAKVDAAEFDFGPVLAHHQTLSHQFVLKNPSKRPIRLVGAMAFTPCCSSVEKPPETIPAGGDAKISTRFNPGLQSGRKRVVFEVRTDQPQRARIRLGLIATLFPEWELQPVGDSSPRSPVGQAGRIRYRIVCRRAGREGRDLPDSVECDAPLFATFVSDPVVGTQTRGIVAKTRDVEIGIARATDVAIHRRALRFR